VEGSTHAKNQLDSFSRSDRTPTCDGQTQAHGYYPRRLYILCWSELSRRKLSPTLATPTTLVLTTLVAQCELSKRKIGLLLEVVGRKFSHTPGNPATVGVVRWPADGDTAGSSLRRLSSLQLTQLNSTENYGRRCLTPLSPHRNYILS